MNCTKKMFSEMVVYTNGVLVKHLKRATDIHDECLKAERVKICCQSKPGNVMIRPVVGQRSALLTTFSLYTILIMGFQTHYNGLAENILYLIVVAMTTWLQLTYVIDIGANDRLVEGELSSTIYHLRHLTCIYRTFKKPHQR